MLINDSAAESDDKQQTTSSSNAWHCRLSATLRRVQSCAWCVVEEDFKLVHSTPSCQRAAAFIAQLNSIMGKKRPNPTASPDDTQPRTRKKIPEQPTFVGIDVGGVRKGFHIAALRGDVVVSIERVHSPALAARRCSDMNAAAIAVDAPCGWSSDGRSRLAERSMLLHGIRAYNVPARHLAQLDGFHAWMLQALLSSNRTAHSP